MDNNYTLYSFKHLSNVRKFRAGWTLAEICSANRHGSLSETETYLKELLKFVRSDKAIPSHLNFLGVSCRACQYLCKKLLSLVFSLFQLGFRKMQAMDIIDFSG